MVVLTNAQDSYALQSRPTRNYNTLGNMALQDGAFGYIFYSNPVPARARVQTAILRVWSVEQWGGTITLTLARISKSWKAGRLNWKNKPGVSAGTKTIQKTNAPAGTMWEFDVTDWMQAVVDGAPWYGFRIDANGTTRKRIHSTQAKPAAMRPQLEITWTTDPVAPTSLVPSSNRAVSIQRPTLRFDYTGTGTSALAAYQVQFASTSGGFGAPSFDTGEVASSLPQYNTTQATPGGTWAGLAVGASTWWRVRVKDQAGIWSPYSTPAQFRRVAKPAANLVSPLALEESTPPIVWSMAGQTAFQVRVTDLATMALLWDSGRVTSADDGVTPPRVMTTVGGHYRIEVWLWDNVSREATPGDPTHVRLATDLTFTPSATPTPTDTLSVTKLSPLPIFQLEWTDAVMPDQFAVLLNGKVVELYEAPDVLVAGTTDTYRSTLYKVPGRQTHDFEVARVVNGQQSTGNPTETIEVRNVGPWLMEKDGSNAIMLLNPAPDPSLEEEAEVLYPLEAPPVLIIQAQWGYSGSVAGTLTDSNVAGLTARQLKDRLLAMRKQRGQTFYLLWSDEAVECFIYNVQVDRVNNADGTTDYDVSFDFVQTDYA